MSSSSRNSGYSSGNSEVKRGVDGGKQSPKAEEKSEQLNEIAGRADVDYRKAKTSVWWDIENCPVPRNCDAHLIAQNISSALLNLDYGGSVSISAYGDTNRLSSTVQHALSSTGISLNHVPAGVKDASDKKILVDMLLWAVDNPAPANYLLISGDRDFANALHQLRMRRYNILLAQPFQASAALVAAAKSVWLWPSLVDGCPPLAGSDSPQSSGGKSRSNHGSFSTVHNGENKVKNEKKRKAEGEVNTQNQKRKKDHQTNCGGKIRNIAGRNAGALKNQQKQKLQTNMGKSERKICNKCSSEWHSGKDCQGNLIICYNCGQPGHRKNACKNEPMNQQNQSLSSSITHSQITPSVDNLNVQGDCQNINEKGNLILCYNCGKPGHKKSECKNGPMNQQNQSHPANKSCITDSPSVNNFQQNLNSSGNNVQNINEKGNLILCYNCGKSGHKKYECKNEPMNQQNQSHAANIFTSSVSNLEGTNNFQADGQNIMENHTPLGQGGNHEIIPLLLAAYNATQGYNDNQLCGPILVTNQDQTTQVDTHLSNGLFRGVQSLFQTFQRATKTVSNLRGDK